MISDISRYESVKLKNMENPSNKTAVPLFFASARKKIYHFEKIK